MGDGLKRRLPAVAVRRSIPALCRASGIRAVCGLAAALAASLTAGASPAAAPVVNVRPIDTGVLKQELAKRRGKVVLVNLWATWCPPCVASYPDLVKVGRAYAPRGLDVLSISVDDPKTLASKVAPFLRKEKPGFATFIKRAGGDEAFMKSLDPKWQGDLPADFVYGPDGKRVATLTAQPNLNRVKQWVTRELALVPNGGRTARR